MDSATGAVVPRGFEVEGCGEDEAGAPEARGARVLLLLLLRPSAALGASVELGFRGLWAGQAMRMGMPMVSCFAGEWWGPGWVGSLVVVRWQEGVAAVAGLGPSWVDKWRDRSP